MSYPTPRFDRLRDVARACREAPNPEQFTMTTFQHRCGTPACALGHYVARRDLSPRFGFGKEQGRIRDRVTHKSLFIDDKPICNWFGITNSEWEELFGSSGCGRAQSHIAAAAYIEMWCAERERP